MISEYLPSLGQLVLIAIGGWATLLFSLATLWTANTRASWLARLSPIGLLLATLIPMGCFAFAGVFAAQAMMVMSYFAAARAVRCGLMRRSEPQEAGGCQTLFGKRNRWRPQFSLGRMFIAFLVCAIILTLVMRAPEEDEIIDLSTLAAWVQVALLGLALAIATILAWSLAAMGHRRTVGAAVAGLFLAALLGEQSGIATRLGAGLEITDRWLIVFAWILTSTLALTCCLALLAKAGWSWWPRTFSATRPPSTLARLVVVLIAVLLMVPTIDLGWAMIPPSPSTQPEAPRPNGYDVVAQIERKLNWDSITADDPLEASMSEATQFTRDNQDHLVELAAALELPSQVVIDWRPGYPPSSPNNIYHDVYYAWNLAAKAASGGGDDGRAAEYYLEVLRASNVCANGGTAIDEFVANTLVGDVANRLAGLLKQLSDDQIEHVQRVTQQCLSGREPIAPIIYRNDRHDRITAGWTGRVATWFVKRHLSDGFDATVELPNHRAARDARLNLLIVECALHRYHLKHDQYPEKLSQLEPDFLQQLARDPFTDGLFQYRRTGAGYLLYSVNADGIDDGGVQDGYHRLYEGDLMLTPTPID